MPDEAPDVASDLTLVESARAGSERAFAELWRRHHGAVIAATRSFTGFDADDIVQEAFAKVFAQIRAGEGPTIAFRAYLARTARNIAIDMARRANAQPAGEDIEQLAGARPDHADGVLDGVALRSAFSSLPTRWQEVLWYRDVEQLPVKECAQYAGMSENATTALIKRAREGLKQAWILAHMDAATPGSDECTWVVERLPRFAREKSTTADDARIRAHLGRCDPCARMAEESRAVHRSLALVLLPFLLAGGAATYLRWIHSGDNRSLPMARGAEGVATAGGTAAAAAPVAARGRPAWRGGAIGALAAAAGVGLVLVLLQPFGGSVRTEASAGARPLLQPMPDVRVTGPELPPAPGPGAPRARLADPREPGPPDRGVLHEATPEDAAPPVGQGETAGTDPAATAPADDAATAPEPPAGHVSDPAIVQAVGLPSAADLERGVYPRLVGSATSGATVTLIATGEDGRTVTDTVTADESGAWEYTLHTVEGAVTLTASQTYPTSAGTVVDQAAATEVYEVGPYLTLELVAQTESSTLVIVHGLPGSVERQHVVNYRSAIPELNGRHSYVRAGGDRFLVWLPLSQITEPIEYWQGDEQVSAVRVWTPPAY